MRLHILAVGRARGWPEAVMVADYLDRATKTGRAVGVPEARLTEIEQKRGLGMSGEADRLRRAIPDGARIVALDERGTLLSSPDFTAKLADWRDAGIRNAAFLIGGADGLDPALRKEADLVLSFGPMVWPHMLARVMLAEQLYRATSILARTPYHRA